MRTTRLSITASVLLAGSAGLSLAAAWQRWAGVCGYGDLDVPACAARQDHRFDAMFRGATWEPIGSMAQLLGLGTILLAIALVLVPGALGRRLSTWQWGVLVLGAVSLLPTGIATLLSGVAGTVVEVPLTPAFAFLALFALPLMVPLALFTRDADGQRAGLRGGLVVWMLVLTTPFFQLVLGPLAGGGASYDTSPWSEAVAVPFLLVAALALAPWRAQRSFSNQHLAHGLSL